ncbi:MAG: hypothetical protein ACK5M3_19475 [Dysgonomonas sp.]
MIIRNLKRWIALPLLLGVILYACQSEDSPDIDTKQPVEPLTVAMTQSLYQQYVGTTAYLKNDDGNDDFDLIPDWDTGQLFSDSNWYVVESPLELGDGKELVFSTAEVKSHDETRPYSIVRQVVMRNKYTGLDYAFVMIVMPTWEYMQERKDQLYGNQYLTRADDLSGEVIFLDTKGEFINGWRYSGGEITHTMIVPEQQLKAGRRTQYCWHQDVYVSEKLISSNYTCIEWNEYDQTNIIDEGLSGSGEVNYTEPMNSGANPPNNNPPNDKKPETRTDCPASAAVNASNAESAMKGNADITSKMSTLRNYASGKSNEYGMLINVVNGSLQGGSIQTGSYGSLNMIIGSNTAYTIHSHHYGGQRVPSASDIYETIVGVGKSSQYKGSVILAYDGSEYLIYVEDYQKAKEIYNDKGWLAVDSQDRFINPHSQDIYNNMYTNMNEQGYSKDNAHIYAMMALLDWVSDYTGSGIKISIKNSEYSQFKEIKVDRVDKIDATNGAYYYKPSICK